MPPREAESAALGIWRFVQEARLLNFPDSLQASGVPRLFLQLWQVWDKWKQITPPSWDYWNWSVNLSEVPYQCFKNGQWDANIVLPFVAVQSLSHVRLFATPWTTASQVSPSFTISQSLLRLMSIESMMPSNQLILCLPLLPLPSIFPTIRAFPMSQLFVSGGQIIGASASASVLSKNIQGWFSRIEWVDLLAVQGTLKCLLQHHSSKASILWQSAFFRVQLSHPYRTTGKTIALYLYGPLLAKWCLSFLMCCLGLS